MYPIVGNFQTDQSIVTSLVYIHHSVQIYTARHPKLSADSHRIFDTGTYTPPRRKNFSLIVRGIYPDYSTPVLSLIVTNPCRWFSDYSIWLYRRIAQRYTTHSQIHFRSFASATKKYRSFQFPAYKAQLYFGYDSTTVMESRMFWRYSPPLWLSHTPHVLRPLGYVVSIISQNQHKVKYFFRSFVSVIFPLPGFRLQIGHSSPHYVAVAIRFTSSGYVWIISQNFRKVKNFFRSLVSGLSGSLFAVLPPVLAHLFPDGLFSLCIPPPVFP